MFVPSKSFTHTNLDHVGTAVYVPVHQYQVTYDTYDTEHQSYPGHELPGTSNWRLSYSHHSATTLHVGAVRTLPFYYATHRQLGQLQSICVSPRTIGENDVSFRVQLLTHFAHCQFITTIACFHALVSLWCSYQASIYVSTEYRGTYTYVHAQRTTNAGRLIRSRDFAQSTASIFLIRGRVCCTLTLVQPPPIS